MKHQVLIIEDDRRLAEMLALHLSKHSCEVELAYEGEEGLERALSGRYELIILDRNLPFRDGLEICRIVRRHNRTVCVLMLTALSDELDLVIGFETGADDYVGKPFKLAELIARVNALLRRSAVEAERLSDGMELSRPVYGELEIDIGRRKVKVAGKAVELTPREFDLLVFLARCPGRVFTREQILQEVWGSDVLGYDHSINTIVKRIRRKLAQKRPELNYIETIRGVGYRFTEQQ